MQLIIRGDDKRKAKTWMQFAKNKLRQIKAFAPEPIIINESFRPVLDILVHIKSVNGIDTVRIETVGGKYMCDFPAVNSCSIPCSDFLLRCPAQPKKVDEFLEIGFLSKTNDIVIGADWDNYAWELGDGEVDNGASVFHQYDEPGEYTVSLTVSKNPVSTIVPVNNLSGVGHFGTDFKEYPVFADANDAYAAYLASVPTPNTDAFKWTATATHDLLDDSRISYASHDSNYSVNLTAVTPGSIVSAYTQFITIDEDSGESFDVVSSLGEIITVSPLAPLEPIPNFYVGDLSPFVGSVKVFGFTESTGNAQIPISLPAGGGITNIGVLQVNDPDVLIETPASTKKTTKVIRVYTGRRGHKRSFQVGDSVHT